MSAATDAIALLKADHQEVKELFEKYENLGDRALRGRVDLVEKISRELSIHIFIEEQVFYPRVRRAGKEVKDEVLEGLEEHHVIKGLLAELEGMNPEDERYDAKVSVLQEQVEHHVEEEEQDMFPRVRRALDEAELRELGSALEATRAQAPTRPSTVAG